MNKSQKIKKTKTKFGVKRVFLLLFTIAIILDSVGLFLLYGPFTFIRETLITTAMTTMSHQYLATWFFDDATIQKVLLKNQLIEPNEDTNPDLINLKDFEENNKYASKYEKDLFEGVTEDTLYKKIPVKGTGYDGYIIAVYKPSHVKIAVSSKLGSSGQTIKTIAQNNNAVVAMNASGFYDPDWNSNGGTPHGTVIKNGKVIWDYEDAKVGGGFIGFNQDDVLVLGRMTKQQALAKGIRDGIEFGPFLIVNGKPAFSKGDGGWGIAPRSAIAQRKDGIVLFAVINGRNYLSGILGIDMVGLTELLMNYGAYNAANLDGGTSSALVEKGNLINNPINSNGKQGVMRGIPTAWVVVE